MATKNYSDLIANKSKRTLTAKGNKFVWRCFEIVAAANASHVYAAEMKPVKYKLREILHSLIIDKEMSIQQIKSLIEQSKDFTIKKLNN